MATTEEPRDQLAIRIPKELHSRLKLYWVTHDIAVRHFLMEAIEPTLFSAPRRRCFPAVGSSAGGVVGSTL